MCLISCRKPTLRLALAKTVYGVLQWTEERQERKLTIRLLVLLKEE
jgi:hypothetical protein